MECFDINQETRGGRYALADLLAERAALFYSEWRGTRNRTRAQGHGLRFLE